MTIQTFDVVVVGAGPAGLEAAATVASAGLSVAAIDRMGPGGQLMNLGALQGLSDRAPESLFGPDLVAELAERAMSAGAELAIDDVLSVAIDGGFVIEALEGKYKALALVIASGLTPGTTGLEDEARFDGAGLSHCAHCDAPLYAGQAVAAAGSDAWAVEEAIVLAEHAASVTLIVPDMLAAPDERVSLLRGLGNVDVVTGSITALEGQDALEGVRIADGQDERQVAARGLFLQTGRTPARAFLPAAVTAADGVFFAGDVRDGAERTIASAIADGTKAGQNAVEWVRSRRGA